MTESPRKNILLTNLSLLTGFPLFTPLPDFGTSVHISFTFSKTMLQWRSKAFTLARSLWLLRQLINTCRNRKKKKSEEEKRRIRLRTNFEILLKEAYLGIVLHRLHQNRQRSCFKFPLLISFLNDSL